MLLTALLLFTQGCSYRHYAVDRDAERIAREAEAEKAAIVAEEAAAKAEAEADSLQNTATEVIEEIVEQEESSTAPVKGDAESVIEYAKKFLGKPYVFGASGPDRFDCSGYTWFVFSHEGYQITRSSSQQFNDGEPVEDFSDLKRGDLVFFGGRRNVRIVGHVGIVTDIDRKRGSFSFIHASTSNGVEIQKSTHPYFMMRYLGARRIIPD